MTCLLWTRQDGGDWQLMCRWIIDDVAGFELMHCGKSMGRKSFRISPELWVKITYVVGGIHLYWLYITHVLVVDFERFYGRYHQSTFLDKGENILYSEGKCNEISGDN